MADENAAIGSDLRQDEVQSQIHYRLIEKLSDSERQYRELVENLREVVFECDREGRLLFVNGAWEQLLGYRSEDCIGKRLSEFVVGGGDARLNGLLTRSADNGASRSTLELRLRHALGQSIFVDLSLRPLTDRAVGSLHDVTDRKRLEFALREAEEAAKRSSIAKSELLSRVSHELRTPLNAILGFARLLEMGELGDDERADLAQIVGAGHELLMLIDTLIDLSATEDGSLHLALEPVPVAAALRAAYESFLPRASRRAVDMSIDCDDRGAHVCADARRLRQVLDALIENAIVYNEDGGSVVLSARRIGDRRVGITVTDTGPGLPAGQHHRVFVPFDRLGQERSETQGAGLSLATSKRLVEAMGGELGFESTLGEGTVFWVTLPRVENSGRMSPRT